MAARRHVNLPVYGNWGPVKVVKGEHKGKIGYRKVGEKVKIGPNIEVMVVAIEGGQAKLGIVAPGLAITRDDMIKRPNAEAVRQ